MSGIDNIEYEDEEGNVVDVDGKEFLKFQDDKIRYRTFKVFKTSKEATLDNGDIMVYKKLIGRVVAVTVPVDDTMEDFYADFAFCSIKDKFSKEVGKKLAYDRLIEKVNGSDDVYLIHRDFDNSITDTLKDIISTDFYDKITWMRGVKSTDIM